MFLISVVADHTDRPPMNTNPNLGHDAITRTLASDVSDGFTIFTVANPLDSGSIEYFSSTRGATQLITTGEWEWWSNYESTTVPTHLLTTLQGGSGEHSADSSAFSWYPISWSWVLILQLISAFVGIVGNFLVIIVLFQRRRLSRSTDTLIGGLACADLLTSAFLIRIPLPAYIPKTWLGEVYCKLIKTQSLLWVSVTASTYLLMSISVERYIAVVYPLHFKRLITRRRVSIFIIIVWFLSVLSGLFAFIVYGVDAKNQCTEQYTFANAQTIIAYYWFCLRLAVPCLTMLVTQILIARNLSQQFRSFRDITHATTPTNGNKASSFHIVARNRVLKLMLTVIIIYIVCWTPNQIAYLGYSLGWVPISYLNSPLHRMLTVLGFYNSCANPIIYAARYPEFRNALKDMFTCKSAKNAPLFDKMDMSKNISTSKTDIYSV
ncbi:apelin receptor B-like [Strongylocentrotus purpuratus]|uniref:G-protein coupled receptors family 1 profile domain-containing protein n=1 Tax=Strongylocentrotus purpuratus TaxID=7668 RepID=A0A7M7N3D6_STRPU|nr:apelin receptor B-like [Strongylocentrotus purpuratus]